MSKNVHSSILKLVVCGLLTALGVILGGLLSIPAMPFGSYTLKIGFGVLPVLLAGVLFGPVYGGIVGALTDLLQALLFPKGAYMPWFTLVGIFSVFHAEAEANIPALACSHRCRATFWQRFSQHAPACRALWKPVGAHLGAADQPSGDDPAL